jgi:hypothetical protein
MPGGTDGPPPGKPGREDPPIPGKLTSGVSPLVKRAPQTGHLLMIGLTGPRPRVALQLPQHQTDSVPPPGRPGSPPPERPGNPPDRPGNPAPGGVGIPPGYEPPGRPG